MATADNKSKSRHYTPIKKSLFLQILNKYKHVIECKKSNFSTLREKESAWNDICEEFNNSSLITQERSVQQLKKLWTNIKQTQRDVITKEKQNKFATGGGPETPSTELDPDVASIVPSLMATAPTLFSSNMDDEEVEDKYRKQLVHNIMDDMAENELDDNMKDNNKENDSIKILCKSNTSSPKEIIADMMLPKRKTKLQIDMTGETNKTVKKRKFTETEDEVKIIRIKNIIEQERQMAEAKLRHEETMATIKETHLKEMNKVELRTSLAKAELAEILLKKEKDYTLRL
ncbi:uncharacterized protein [Temnothorax longispinosus]|uniref:uncharacterized protein n=1 Tax=Temnothorax longispinosus TaxID=300112 RepID=UPI003A99C600